MTNVSNPGAMPESIVNLFFVPLEDYNKITGQNKTLQDDEAMLYSNRAGYTYPTLHVFDRTYHITLQLGSFLGNGLAESNVASTQFLVVKDIEAVQADLIPAIRLYCGIDLNGTDEVKNAVYQELWAELIETAQLKGRVTLENKVEERVDFFTMYAGFFFLGIFLGVLFIMATILIIYYKQISEGYDDKEPVCNYAEGRFEPFGSKTFHSVADIDGILSAFTGGGRPRDICLPADIKNIGDFKFAEYRIIYPLHNCMFSCFCGFV